MKLALRGQAQRRGGGARGPARVFVSGALTGVMKGKLGILMQGLRVGGLEGSDPVTGHWTTVLRWARD